MNNEKRELIKKAHQICLDKDRSTDYACMFMQDYSGCTFEELMEYIDGISWGVKEKDNEN